MNRNVQIRIRRYDNPPEGILKRIFVAMERCHGSYVQFRVYETGNIKSLRKDALDFLGVVPKKGDIKFMNYFKPEIKESVLNAFGYR